jgi:hypothetical protein
MGAQFQFCKIKIVREIVAMVVQFKNVFNNTELDG